MDKKNSATPELFVQLLTSHQGRIRKFILSLVPNFNDVDDIMQETTTKMWSRFSDFQVGTDFLSWAFQIAYYRVLEFRQSKHHKVLFDSQLIEDIYCDIKERQNIQNQIIQHLYQCVSKLPLPDQEILKLKYEENLTVKAIASRIGKSVHGLYRHVAKIHEWLLLCIKHSDA